MKVVFAIIIESNKMDINQSLYLYTLNEI